MDQVARERAIPRCCRCEADARATLAGRDGLWVIWVRSGGKNAAVCPPCWFSRETFEPVRARWDA